jgi:enoyl-[acyl-carrier-protein] reductase (NADH)
LDKDGRFLKIVSLYDAFGPFLTLLLHKQTAVITGAGSAQGIGFAIARRLRAAGARVVIASTTDRIHTRARELDEMASCPSSPISL